MRERIGVRNPSGATGTSRFQFIQKGAALLLLVFGVTLFGLEPPRPGQIEQYKCDGTLPDRIAAAKAFGNHKVAPQLVWGAKSRLQRLVTGANSPDLLAPPPCWQGGLPASGSRKMLTLLIAFSDMPPVTGDTQALIYSKLFQDGTAGLPFDSLRNFYLRSSYSLLNISGNTLGWYTTTYPRASVPETTAGRDNLIKEALNYYNTQGHDFTQYDNDGDGTIDYFAVIWTGAHGAWASFWWGYQTGFSDPAFTLDGKTLDKYSWQWESASYPTGLFEPSVVIHETGHGLGLPDYYDYDAAVGPDGGVGGIDMMDANYGDHNCFSKFLLEWITPTVCNTGGTHTVTLRPSESTKDALVVWPTATAGNAFDEFFMVQVRNETQNDVYFPGSGLLIWHVDARLDPASGYCGYLYNNSGTDHKLLRLMEADGLEEIETYSAFADAGDYYTQGSSLANNTVPDSKSYAGAITSVTVEQISAYGDPMSFNLNCDAITCTAPGAPNLTSATGDCDGVTLNFTAGTGTTESFHVYRSTNTSCPVGTLTKLNSYAIPASTPTYRDTTGSPGTTYTYVVRGACDLGGAGSSANSNCRTGTRPVPGAPTLNSATGNCSGVTLAWTAGSGTTNSYNVYRSTNSTCPVGTLTKLNNSPIPSGTLSYTDASVVGGTAYTYVVRGACDTAGANESANSNCLAGARAVPGPPTLTGATGVCTGNDLSWTPGSGTTNSYNVYRSSNTVCPAGALSKLNSSPLPSSTLTYRDTTALSGVKYTYVVRGACDTGGVGESADSNCLAAMWRAPGAPTLTAVTDGCGSVDLTWTAGSTGTTLSYNVYRSTNTTCPAGTLTKLNASPIPSGTPSYSDTTAVSGTTYTYVVRGACDAGGLGESANSNCLTGARYAPGAPTLNSSGDCAGVNLSWTPGTGATLSYNVYRRIGACGGAYTKLAGPLTGLVFSDTTAVPGTSYAYVVRGACDAGGVTESADSNCLASAGATPPAPVIIGALGMCSIIEVSWSSTPGATSYNLMRGTSCGTALTTFPGVTNTYYDDSTAVRGTTYNYWVVAVNGSCISAESSCVSGARTPLPEAPTNVTATPGCSGNTIAWTNAVGATSHNVRRGTACGNNQSTFSGVTTPYNDTTAVVGTTYYYWVEGVGLCGTGPVSSCASATAGAPAAPTGVTATPDCTFNHINWTNSPGATSHNLLRGTTCGTVVTTFTGVTKPYKDFTAVAGTTYNYWVVGVNSCGTSGNSDCVTARRLSVPAAPSAPTFTSVLDTGLTVNWTAVSGAASYDVWRVVGPSCTGAVKITGTPVPGLSYPDEGLTCNMLYSYFITANNTCGASASGACAHATTASCAVAPPEIAPGDSSSTGQSWADKTTHTWPSNASCTSGYILYRGTQADLPQLLNASEESCLRFRGYSEGENAKSGMTEDPSAVAGRFYWYLVTGMNGIGEGTAGSATGGTRSMDLSGDCLTP